MATAAKQLLARTWTPMPPWIILGQWRPSIEASIFSVAAFVFMSDKRGRSRCAEMRVPAERSACGDVPEAARNDGSARDAGANASVLPAQPSVRARSEN